MFVATSSLVHARNLAFLILVVGIAGYGYPDSLQPDSAASLPQAAARPTPSESVHTGWVHDGCVEFSDSENIIGE